MITRKDLLDYCKTVEDFLEEQKIAFEMSMIKVHPKPDTIIEKDMDVQLIGLSP